MWAVFFLAPFAVGIATYCAALGQLSMRTLVLTILGIAILECVLTTIGYADSSVWQTLLVLSLGVIGPWLAVMMFHLLMPMSRRPITTALGTPLVYVLGVLIGLGVGDMTGWIAQ